MSCLRLALTVDANNPNIGDLYLDDSGQLEWIGLSPADETDYARMILQRIRCRLMFIRGEWYLDQRQGTPWREKVWIKGPNVDTIRRIIREVVEKTPGVDSVSTLSIELDSQSRTLTLTIVAVADTGAVITTDLLDTPLIVEIPHG